MESIIAAVVIVVIVALAAGYIYKEKKSGKHCIGCPDSGTCGMCSGCSGGCGGSCGSHCEQ